MSAISDIVRVLPAQPGVCRLCRSWSDVYSRCWGCKELSAPLRHAAPVVLPLALADNPSSLQEALAAYKSSGTAASTAKALLLELLDAMLPRHEACLRRAADVTAFDFITFVPGTRDRGGAQPLQDLLGSSGWSAPRLEPLLAPLERSSDVRAYDLARFAVTTGVAGYTILLLDDTLTTGASALSAAGALQAAGAARVGIVVLGRHFRPDFKRCRLYHDEARREHFDPAWCALCDPRRPDSPLPNRELRRAVEGHSTWADEPPF